MIRIELNMISLMKYFSLVDINHSFELIINAFNISQSIYAGEPRHCFARLNPGQDRRSVDRWPQWEALSTSWTWFQPDRSSKFIGRDSSAVTVTIIATPTSPIMQTRMIVVAIIWYREIVDHRDSMYRRDWTRRVL